MAESRTALRTNAEPGDPPQGGWEELSDESLVKRTLGGSGEAFGELARRHRASALRAAASIVGPDRAEDVVQDAFYLAFRALRMLNDPTRFPQWLGRITRYRAMRLGRTESRRAAGRVSFEGDFPDTPRVPELPAYHDDVARLEAALGRIPETFSGVLRLHFLEGLPHQKIAEQLGVSLSTSKWRCFRGKQLLRSLLEPSEPATSRIESACERCRLAAGGVSCESVFGELPDSSAPPCARLALASVRSNLRRRPSRANFRPRADS